MLAGLWWGWLRVGLLGFGGGPSVIPLIKAEALSRGWATEEQFLDTLALGNTLPGPIAVKLAWALGQQAGGLVGAAVAVVALCLPGVALMTTLAALFGRFRDQPAVAGMMRGARAAAVGMLAWTAISLAPDGVRDVKTAVVAAVSLALLLWGAHPAPVMAAAMVVGIFVR